MNQKEKTSVPEKKFGLIDESDRGAAIVGAALLEDSLVKILKGHMRVSEMSRKQVDDLFDLSGPLSNFSAKISMAFAFGLVDKVTFLDLQVVRKLRNKFAHSSENLSFDDESVMSQIQNMYTFRFAYSLFERSFSPPKDEVASEWRMREDGYIRLNKAAFSIAVKQLSMRVEHSFYIRTLKELGRPLPEVYKDFIDIYES